MQWQLLVSEVRVGSDVSSDAAVQRSLRGGPARSHTTILSWACELFVWNFSSVRTTVWQEEILGLNKVPTWCSPELLE